MSFNQLIGLKKKNTKQFKNLLAYISYGILTNIS